MAAQPSCGILRPRVNRKLPALGPSSSSLRLLKTVNRPVKGQLLAIKSAHSLEPEQPASQARGPASSRCAHLAGVPRCRVSPGMRSRDKTKETTAALWGVVTPPGRGAITSGYPPKGGKMKQRETKGLQLLPHTFFEGGGGGVLGSAAAGGGSSLCQLEGH